jgi:pullulanase/glycogen debranching enzyme
MTSKHDDRDIRPGDWTRLGANYDADGVNFAIFSAHAERIELCLFDDGGKNETASRCPSSPTRSGKATSRDLSRPRYGCQTPKQAALAMMRRAVEGGTLTSTCMPYELQGKTNQLSPRCRTTCA